MTDTIPTERDWRSEPWGLDTETAYNHFFGKTVDEAVGLFKHNALFYQEDVMWMPAACFPYYVRAFMTYLLSAESKYDSDGASSFFGLVEVRANDINRDANLTSAIENCLGHLAKHQNFYDAEVSIYGDFADRAQRVLKKLRR